VKMLIGMFELLFGTEEGQQLRDWWVVVVVGVCPIFVSCPHHPPTAPPSLSPPLDHPTTTLKGACRGVGRLRGRTTQP
jgi:hypothetical protein